MEAIIRSGDIGKTKVSIAVEVLRDPTASEDVREQLKADIAYEPTQEMVTRPNKGDQYFLPGSPIRINDGIRLIARHEPTQPQMNPVCVDFSLWGLKNLVNKSLESKGIKISLMNGIGALDDEDDSWKDYVVRAYFAKDEKAPNESTTLVFVLAKRNQTHTDTFDDILVDKVYNVGSACPPDCLKARQQVSKSDTTTGAVLGRDALGIRTPECMKYREGSGMGSLCI